MKTERLLFSVLALLFSLSAGTLNARDKVKDRFTWQNQIMPQEKVHIMTDRNHYIGGDTIWLRPFIVDGLTYKPAYFSRFLYVELLNQSDSLVYRAKLHQQPERDDNNMRGYIPLDITLPTGIYTLVGYTRWMLNAGEKFFFKRNVQVINARDLNDGVRPAMLAQTNNTDEYHPIDTTSFLRSDFQPGVIHPELKTDKEIYGQRNFVEVKFDAPANTVLAASVTDDATAPVDPTNSIRYDLMGQPYLHRIEDITEGKLKYPKLQPEEFEIITGRVIGGMRGRALKGVEVSMIVPSQGYVDEQVTDERGLFTFDNFDLPDGTKFFLRSHNQAGDQVGEIQLLPELFAQEVHHLKPVLSSVKTSTYYDNLKTRMKYNNGQWEVLLNDIDVIGRTREQEDLTSRNAYVHFDRNQIAPYREYTIETLMNAIPGVTVHHNRPFFRNKPLQIIIDDVLIEPPFGTEITNYLNQICPPYYIDYIDIVKSSTIPNISSVVGPRGGAASAYKKVMTPEADALRIITLKEIPNTGMDSMIKEFNPLGHQHPHEFNNGVYQNLTTPDGTDQRNTLYWNPYLIVDADGHCTFRFWTNDVQRTTYTIRVEGVAEDGTIIDTTKTIKIE